ncbi:HAD family hydrolase [uncultured Acidaminococcus sp.]|uniref:HAD family hydrolase n=1 Tax=uncultured Acidaminococcus sp. TaxID=352152 RepID=UPI002620F43A|nr:HAD-IIIA family hydrolase [uncultured Acidaminococcus sp.]
MKYQAVIFDLDGTLLDTLTDLWNAVNAVCKKYGYPPRTRLQVRRALGNGLERLLWLSLPGDVEENRFQAAFQFFRGYYLKHCNEKTRPYEGILELLRQLQLQGIRLAIVSNKAHPAVLELRDRYFPETMKVAIGESVEVRRKPAPDTVFKALEELGIPKEQAVYVGDSEVDKKTADNAGMDCFLVTWGFRDRDELAALEPAALIDRPEQILEKVM